MGESLSHRIRAVCGSADRHGDAAALFIHGFTDHLGMAMQPADAGAIGRVEFKLDQNATGREPLLDRRR